jgi:hypothetical protein
MGYQYALYQHRKKLREERDMVFQNNNSISREEHGKTIAKIRNTAEKSAETRNTAGGDIA